MCLITEQIEPRIAEEDVVVYKHMFRKIQKKKFLGITIKTYVYMMSPFQFHVYELGVQPKINIVKGKFFEACQFYSNHDSIHYNQKYNLRDLCTSELLISISEGYHSMMPDSPHAALEYENTYKCIIPKGSEYYVGGTGLVVSNQIIILDEKIN